MTSPRPRARHRRRTPLTAGLLLLLGAVACLPPRAAAATNGRVTGRVVDTDTQAPIGNADVELANLSGGQGYFRSHTNSRGEFALDHVPPNRWYTLTASAPGYADFVLGNWQFPAAQRLVDLVIPLDRAGTIDVKLARSDKTPVSGARVTLIQER